ncbi:Trp biosynthesis-associated membrane protein [Rhodoluna sp.]|uniref:Trp biosynthesis-associated membrane protein n=1 Tax=Rhodoluna sp. TaxID=1969481 RepID=UPI0025E7C29D|nr:Trp biosynthesis-associated membrane protein [Rhodoluna sp.]
MKIKKTSALGLWFIALGAATIAASQTWFQLSMSPNGDAVTISEFDGFTSYSFISAVLLASLAAAFVISFVGTLARKIIASFALLLSVAGLALLISRVSTSDISGLSVQIEKATGIAANHGIKNVDVVTTFWAQVGIAGFVLLVLATAIVLLTERHWPARVAKIERRQSVAKAPTDSISLWDSQR